MPNFVRKHVRTFSHFNEQNLTKIRRKVHEHAKNWKCLQVRHLRVIRMSWVQKVSTNTYRMKLISCQLNSLGGILDF